MSKIPISKRFQLPDLDKVIKRQKQNNELNKKYDLNKLLKKQEQNDELNKLLEEQRYELNRLLKKQEQNNEQRNKQEKYIEWDKINKLHKKINELTENINSRSPTDFRTFTPKRNPFNDINKNKEKLTPPLSKIPTPIPKSCEPQGVAAGEQAGVEIMKNELKTLEYYIRCLKKELKQYGFFYQKKL